jgi:cytochrome c-type biogenesis protein CcmH
MSIYVMFAAILGLATLLLVWRSSRAPFSGNTPHTPGIYRDQLAELEQDVATGKIRPDEARNIRSEIARRLLAEEGKTPAMMSTTHSPMPAILLALFVPAVALPVYLQFGHPALPDNPLYARLESAVANNDLAAMVMQVEKRLENAPDDARGWEILAPVYFQMGRFGDAANAYENLLRLDAPTADRYADLGEALAFATEGVVNVGAGKAFMSALLLDPAHPKANFYQAIALKQEGRIGDARALLETMLAKAPQGAGWRMAVEQQIASLAKAPALTAEQMQQGAVMSSSDRQTMITGMVDGLEQKLAANGDDIEGWLKLIRARTVMGEAEKAKQALKKATARFNDKPKELSAINILAKELKLK